MRDVFNRSSGSRLAVALAALALIVLCLVPTPPASRAQEGQGSSGKLSGDGLELQWWLFGAETGPRSFADRTWQANGKITGKTVRFAGVMRLSVPKGMYTNGSMVAYISYPWSTGKQEKNWSGELSDEKGLKRTLTFDFTLDATIGKPIVVSASASKTGGATDLFAVYFTFAPPPPAATPTATPTVAPVADQPISVDAVAAALTAIAAILSGLVAALGALLTTSLSGLDVQDVLNALGYLIRGKSPADGDQDESAKVEHDESATDKRTTQLVDLAAALNKAAQQLKADGKYIANRSVIEKILYLPPHEAKEVLAWMGDVLPDMAQLYPMLFEHGESMRAADMDNSPPSPRPDADPKWGQCGEAVKWCESAMEAPIRKIFGPDAVFTEIKVQSISNPQANHIANLVVAPSGERYVIDMWATMADENCAPKIYTEAEWLEKWKKDFWVGRSVTITRDDPNNKQPGSFTLLQKHVFYEGVERGIKAFHHSPDYNKNPGQAETAIKSYKAHPWQVSANDESDVFEQPNPNPEPNPDPTKPMLKPKESWHIGGRY